MYHCRAMPVIAAVLTTGAMLAQRADHQAKPLTFGAATVRPVTSQPVGVPDANGRTIARKQPGKGGNSEHPGRVHYQESLHRLLMRAYGLAYYQIQGPDWLSNMFVVDAVMPADATPEQLRVMLRNLVMERFTLAAHRETKQPSGYSLVVAKGGRKLKVWTRVLRTSTPPLWVRLPSRAGGRLSGLTAIRTQYPWRDEVRKGES